jgi:opacity protein-like surface antigen
MPFSRAHDSVGVSLGMNLHRYLGLELAGEFYELHLTDPGLGKIGELAVGAAIPQVRLRYPLLHDRLVPYVIGGAGVAVSQFNDRTIFATDASVETDGAKAMGSIGGGLEYHVADNVALGLEGKYLISPDYTVKVNGAPENIGLSAGLMSFSLRVLYPQLDPRTAASGASGSATLYAGVRAGGGMPVHDRVFGNVEGRAEQASIGPFDQLYGAAIGLNVGRHFGVEVPFEGFEMSLRSPTHGCLGEYAVYAVIPQMRLRYPLLDGRLDPYLIGGVGMSFGEFNEQAIAKVNVDGNDFGVGATLGTGIEYYLATNIAVGAEARYLFARGHELQVGSAPAMSGNLDSFLLTLNLRIFMFDFGG